MFLKELFDLGFTTGGRGKAASGVWSSDVLSRDEVGPKSRVVAVEGPDELCGAPF